WSSDVCSSDLDLLPRGDALAHGADRGQGANLQLIVDVAAAEVVDDQHVPAARREVQGRGPAAEAVAAQNHHAHQSNLVFNVFSCLAERARGRKRGAWLRRKRRRMEKQSPIRLNRLKSEGVLPENGQDGPETRSGGPGASSR